MLFLTLLINQKKLQINHLYVLFYIISQVIRSAASGASGQTSLPVSKEMHYVFRVLGPAACRDPDIFTTVATNTLRLAILPASKRGNCKLGLPFKK